MTTQTSACTYIWQDQTLASATKGQWHQLVSPLQSNRIVTDTRQVSSGDVFLAIRGERFDAHDFIGIAKEKGAVAAIVERVVDCDLPQLVVADTKLALGDLGGFRRMAHPDLTVVALTGSAGKTTTKQMIGSILSKLAPTLITRGNLNNDLGVPMMLLELQDNQKFAVLELGANHVGEIAYTANMVKPSVACVLNIGTAHLGEFGGRDKIAAAKAEIYSALDADGVAILPFFDDYYEFLAGQAGQFTSQMLSFGERQIPLQEAGLSFEDRLALQEQGLEQVLVMGDLFADDVEVFSTHSTFTLNTNIQEGCIESLPVKLPFVGEHNVVNALAAAATTFALGVDLATIVAGLQDATPPQGRLTIQSFGEHTLIDDTYNANPTSMLAAAQVLADAQGQKILVLGDIFELGDESANEHRRLGERLASFDLDVLLAVGTDMAHTVTAFNQVKPAAFHFSNKSDLLEKLCLLMDQETSTVLFKGSRGMAMESLIANLTKK